MQLRVGDLAGITELTTVTGEIVKVHPREKLLHLSFRRFVDCPICNVHIGHLIHRQDEIKRANIEEVVFFHSTADAIRDYQRNIPFTMVADADRHIYRLFGVEANRRGVSGKAFTAGLQGLFKGHLGLRSKGQTSGLPADFLINRDGRVAALKYGAHPADQWSVDELLQLGAANSK